MAPMEAVQQRYRPPRDVTESTVGDLLANTRPIPEAKQLDLGGESPRGLRLWYAGDATLARRPCVAIVGTRRVSIEGAARARHLAWDLVRHGVVVVSGLARGVDTEAMRAAMDAGGKTIGVIGTPIDVASPLENASMQEAVYESHLLVTQFQTGNPVSMWNFPARNRLMALLADATVVIEASDTSGTLHQAAECVKLGRWLFIAKSVVDDSGLKWPRSFARCRVTKTLTRTRDVLDVLKLAA